MMARKVQFGLFFVLAGSCCGDVSEPARPSPLELYVPQVAVPKPQMVVPNAPQVPQVPAMETMPEAPGARMPQMVELNGPQEPSNEVPYVMVQTQPMAEEPASPFAFLGGLAGGFAAGAALVFSLVKTIGQKASDESQKLELPLSVRRTTAPVMQLNPSGSSPWGVPSTPLSSPWDIRAISKDGALTQRVEGKTRKTWKFNDLSKDRVQVALSSEGRPIHSDIQLWIGPDWTPMKMMAYSEDGRLRPLQTLIGTRNKAAMIEVRNNGESEFPFSAASNYAEGPMVALPTELPATTEGERVDGGAIRSYVLDPGTEQVEVVIKTDGRQLNARIELLNAPNNPKQTYECFTNNGELNCLCVAFNTPDSTNTIRLVNLAPVEFPCYIHLRQK